LDEDGLVRDSGICIVFSVARLLFTGDFKRRPASIGSEILVFEGGASFELDFLGLNVCGA
jgi:hypothetical protein